MLPKSIGLFHPLYCLPGKKKEIHTSPKQAMFIAQIIKCYEPKCSGHFRIVQLGIVMVTDKLSPSCTSLACLDHALIHTVYWRKVFPVRSPTLHLSCP